MNSIRWLFLFSKVLLLSVHCFGQTEDSLDHYHIEHADSHYMIHENVPKSKFWGNSWYFASAYTFNRTDELDFNFGRTYGRSHCGGAGCSFETNSWGVGYGFTPGVIAPNNQELKVFWEYNFFWVPPFSVGIRGEYIYDFTNNGHYLRPSAGFSFVFFDIFYNYSFKISGTQNIFRHGLTIRIKYFHKVKNWQKNYPNQC